MCSNGIGQKKPSDAARLQRGLKYPSVVEHSLTEMILQSASEEGLRPLFGRTLLPSVLDRAFKGEL
jgi:hypothetical protein